jgi:mercuric ion transport protein
MAGSVLGGFLASVCCIVPLAFAALGLSGAAFAVRLEPARPYFLVVTYGLLAGAFYLTYRPSSVACAPGDSCGPAASRHGKTILWIVTLAVVLITTFPSYSQYLF